MSVSVYEGSWEQRTVVNISVRVYVCVCKLTLHISVESDVVLIQREQCMYFSPEGIQRQTLEHIHLYCNAYM